jgi:hypothetical protein
MSNEATITVKQDGIDSFSSALWNPQHYEIYIDGEKVGLLDGYRNEISWPISQGPHFVYVRAYARNSNSATRVYGLSQTLDVNVSDGEDRRLNCGLVKGPPIRGALLLIGTLVTILLAFGPFGEIPMRTRYTATAIAALITMACSWIGHSSVPGANIYLREAKPKDVSQKVM